jgi:hypothetical protein
MLKIFHFDAKCQNLRLKMLALQMQDCQHLQFFCTREAKVPYAVVPRSWHYQGLL